VQVPLVTEEEKQKRRTKIGEKAAAARSSLSALARAKTGADQAYKEFKVANFYDETMRHRYVGATRGDHEAAGRLNAADGVSTGVAQGSGEGSQRGWSSLDSQPDRVSRFGGRHWLGLLSPAGELAEESPDCVLARSPPKAKRGWRK